MAANVFFKHKLLSLYGWICSLSGWHNYLVSFWTQCCPCVYVNHSQWRWWAVYVHNCKGKNCLVLQLRELLVRESNGLSCFLFYYLNHCELAVLLVIFLSPSSSSVHSRWVPIQVPHNLLELWGNSERNCNVNWRQSVKGWKHSQFMKDLCVCLFVCI